MNLADQLGDVVVDVEPEPERKEKTVCARLILTHEQVREYNLKLCN